MLAVCVCEVIPNITLKSSYSYFQIGESHMLQQANLVISLWKGASKRLYTPWEIEREREWEDLEKARGRSFLRLSKHSDRQSQCVCVWVSHSVLFFPLTCCQFYHRGSSLRLTVWSAWSGRTEDFGLVDTAAVAGSSEGKWLSDWTFCLSLSTCLWNLACPLTQPAVTALHARASHPDSFFPPLLFCMPSMYSNFPSYTVNCVNTLLKKGYNVYRYIRDFCNVDVVNLLYFSSTQFKVN